MKHRKRIHYTDSQKAVMWDHWQRGGAGRALTRFPNQSPKTSYRLPHCFR